MILMIITLIYHYEDNPGLLSRLEGIELGLLALIHIIQIRIDHC